MSSNPQRTRRKWWTPIALLAAIIPTSIGVGSVEAQEPTASTAPSAEDAPLYRNISEWNLPRKTKLAIKGYDPVAYFPEGGSKAAKGNKSIAYRYMNVTYRFINAVNRERFIANPARYEPAHGGWCSYAMAKDGSKTAPDPKTFIVKGDRLFLFYNGIGGNTKKAWIKMDHASQVEDADRAWKSISSEEPRMAGNMQDTN